MKNNIIFKNLKIRTINKEPIISPLDGTTIQDLKFDTPLTFQEKINKSQISFANWKKKTLRERSQIFYTYRQKLIEEKNTLASLIHKENGKTIEETKAEVDKAIEVTEFACSIPQLGLDESSEVSKGVRCMMTQEPLGVVASITPSNFPVMAPHWTLAICLILGNTLIIKPSEKVPLSMIHCAQLLKESGLPEGCLTIISGNQESVEWICDHPTIKAISFVGSTPVAQAVYTRVTSQFKRALCLGGASRTCHSI